MSSIGNKPAYPAITLNGDGERVYHEGITFREVLIVAAVQGFCSMPDQNAYTPGMTAKYAIAQADAVIAKLEGEAGGAPND